MSDFDYVHSISCSTKPRSTGAFKVHRNVFIALDFWPVSSFQKCNMAMLVLCDKVWCRVFTHLLLKPLSVWKNNSVWLNKNQLLSWDLLCNGSRYLCLVVIPWLLLNWWAASSVGGTVLIAPGMWTQLQYFGVLLWSEGTLPELCKREQKQHRWSDAPPLLTQAAAWSWENKHQWARWAAFASWLHLAVWPWEGCSASLKWWGWGCRCWM